ncbi:hypothetical protein [Bdellovibrio sp. HCB274]|uniref:hypothetical protein n=1 Tax=Bdellovibrio sp. HCB274 TaxID=3394361 RepID=UPI0039B5D475
MKTGVFTIVILIACYFFYSWTRTDQKNTEFSQRMERKIAQVKEQNRAQIQKREITKANQKSDFKTANVPQEQFDEIKVQEVVESFNKHATGITNAWDAYRVNLYKQIGLTDDDLRELDLILERRTELLTDFQNEYRRLGTDPSNSQMLELYKKAEQEMDEDVRLFLGDNRFNYVKSARSIFNRAYSQHYHISIETLGW